MFLDSSPPAYLLEIIFRTVLTLIIAFIVVRLLGKREVEQLTPFDFLFFIALGSVVGNSMLMPDVGLLWSTFVLGTALVVYRLQMFLSKKSEKYDNFTLGKPIKIIENGIINIDNLNHSNITKNDLMLMLRNKSIENLGELKLVYLERNGALSVYKLDKDKQYPGLSTFPLEMSIHPEYHRAGETVPRSAYYSCYETGETHEFKEGDAFPECHGNLWVEFFEP
ncbi:MAG: hypothetical protein AWU59_2536 [Methanolobus sp. T82-4]|jgi:uncharacterized membrane protein YcaP (DUF421 family)|nr:MAG: hypothetical protein AWU59_2536 [Methanolobus sp. T82-4]